MTITAIQQQLATPEGFAKAVTPKSKIFGIAITSLVLSAIGVGMNLFQLGSASGWQWSLMFRYLFDAQAVEFTGSRAGRSEVWRFFYVYGPIVLVPLAIILLIIYFATRSKAGAGLYESYRQRGWIGRQVLPGLKVKNGNSEVNVAFISHPSVPDPEFDAAAQRYASYLATLDKKAAKAVATAALKQKVIAGVSAAALAPDVPPAILAAPAQGDGHFVVVVPPDASDKGAVQVLPIKL
jgi:hypothetical protein